MGTADSSQADTTWRMRIAQFTAFAGVTFVGLYLLRIQGRSARSAAAFSGFMSLWLTVRRADRQSVAHAVVEEQGQRGDWLSHEHNCRSGAMDMRVLIGHGCAGGRVSIVRCGTPGGI
ncbi:MAG: hypothetical protein AB7V43_16875 [Acidimicrobiia bacterium]